MYKIYNENIKTKQIKTDIRLTHSTLGLMIETTANFALACSFIAIT